MKRISNKVLISCLIGEIMALLCTLVLTEKNNYIWLIVATFILMTVFTFYECICRLNNIISSWNENHRIQEQVREEEIKIFRAQLLEEIEQKTKLFSEKVDSICNSQEKMIESNNIFCQNISESVSKIDEKGSQLFTQLKDEFSLRLGTITESFLVLSNNIDAYIIEFTKKTEENGIEITRKNSELITNMVKLFEKQNSELSTLMNNVEKKLLQNSNMASRVLDENISSTRNVVSEIVMEARDLLQKQYEKLEELNSSLSLDTKEYTQQLMEQILAVSNNNILEMKSSCENVLDITVDRIISENEETGTKRTEAFETYIKELEKTYDSIISGHIKALEEQVLKSINLFIAENKSALKTNNELAADLISSEKSFVLEIENNNVKLRETIDNAFVEYSKAVEQNIVDVRNVLAESIATSSQNTIESIGLMSEKNIETVDDLAEKLKVYSDSLIEKSAIAIANVQADNNEKLQNLCEQVDGYISENAKFITYCQELSNALQSSISQMIDDRDRFIDDLNDISDSHLEGFDSHMKSRVQNMVEQLQSLNIENAVLFSRAMDEYREKFVEANAIAIAEVQVDNVSSITDANDKISQLATNLKTFQEDIVRTLYALQSIIETGVSEQKEQEENFDTAMNELVEEKLSEYNKKLQEYNEGIEFLGKKITDVMNACQSNTSKYDETLRHIIEAQKVANSLNDKDVELLKTFMKR